MTLDNDRQTDGRRQTRRPLQKVLTTVCEPKKTLKMPFKPMGRKTHETSHSSWGCGLYIIHLSHGRPHSPPKLHLDRFTQFRTTTPLQSPHWLQWNAPHLPPKLPLSFRRSPSHLIHPSLERPHSPPETASRSNRPFFHNSPTGQTDRRTDRGQATVTLTLY